MALVGADLRLSIGAKRETFPDERMFEGLGIAPDAEVFQQAADSSEGRGRVLNGVLARGPKQ